MSLLRLPPETLVHIFDEIGSSFFREDLDRLTVCKQWFEFALPTFYKCITLSRDTLRSLIASGVIIETPSHPPLLDSLETLDIELRGYYQLCTSSPREYSGLSNSSHGATTAPNDVSRQDPLETWQRDLNSDLSQLAVVAQQSPRLRTLRIRAWSSRSLLDSPEYYLQLPTIQTFLSVENLSVLALDLSGSFLDSSGQQGDGRHICPAIGAVLCTLRNLHLRMRNICPDVLKPRDPNSSLRLGVVVVKLSLTTDLPGITSAAHSKRCGSQDGGLLQLKADIQEQAGTLAARMASPKVVRILTHSLPLFETQSLDVLTGKTMKLADDMAWDEDGKTLSEYSTPESEHFDEEFSTFLDESE